MKKISLNETIEKVNGNFSSVFTKEDVISLLNGIKPESKSTLTSELSDEIQTRIERCLDHNSENFLNLDDISFDIGYDHRIEVSDIAINVYDIMSHIRDIITEYEEVEEEEEVSSTEFTPVEDDAVNEAWSFPRGEDDVVELERGETQDGDSEVTVY
jgi:ACT domain-containing protein